MNTSKDLSAPQYFMNETRVLPMLQHFIFCLNNSKGFNKPSFSSLLPLQLVYEPKPPPRNSASSHDPLQSLSSSGRSEEPSHLQKKNPTIECFTYLLFRCSSFARTFFGILMLCILSTCLAHWSLLNLITLTRSTPTYRFSSFMFFLILQTVPSLTGRNIFNWNFQILEALRCKPYSLVNVHASIFIVL